MRAHYIRSSIARGSGASFVKSVWNLHRTLFYNGGGVVHWTMGRAMHGWMGRWVVV